MIQTHSDCRSRRWARRPLDHHQGHVQWWNVYDVVHLLMPANDSRSQRREKYRVRWLNPHWLRLKCLFSASSLTAIRPLQTKTFNVFTTAGRDRNVWLTDVRSNDRRALICQESSPVLKMVLTPVSRLVEMKLLIHVLYSNDLIEMMELSVLKYKYNCGYNCTKITSCP